MSGDTKVLVLLEQTRLTGLVRQLVELLVRLPKAGVQPRLVCVVRQGDDVEALARELGSRGIPFDGLVERHVLDPGPLRKIRRIVDRWSPDVLESHGYKTVAYARALRLVIPDLPWVAFYHGRTSTDWKVRLYHLFARWAVGAACAIAPVAEGVESHFRPRDRKRLVPIPNALLPITGTGRERADIRRELGIDDDVPLIGFVGRFSREKAPDLFVRIFADLIRIHPELHGAMLGEGPLRADVESWLANHGLSDRVRLTGRVDDVADYYAAMDALLIPSRSEVFPNVLLEAVGAGVPVAAAPVGGIPGIARHVDTVFVGPGGDSTSLARAAGEALALQDPGRLASSRERLASEYSLDRRAELAAELYKSVLECAP